MQWDFRHAKGFLEGLGNSNQYWSYIGMKAQNFMMEYP